MFVINGRRAKGALALVAGLGVMVLGGASAHAVMINYQNFDSASGLSLNGVAALSPGLFGEHQTLSITPPVRGSAGAFYLSQRQQVDQGFTTSFTFRIRDRSGTGSDGFSFIIQNQGANALGGSGGAIGFGTNLTYPTGNTGISNSLAVVFDTWDNSSNWATIPGANIITVQTSHLGPNAPNTPSSIDSIAAVAANGAFNDGATHTVQITYVPGLMQIYYDNLVIPALTAPVNLANSLNLFNGTDAFVGFTAGTGAIINVQRQEIRSWSFASNAPAPAAAGVLGLGGLALARRRRR